MIDYFLSRYKDGDDSIGEHRDDEKDLVADSPIASLSLGQKRDFVFKHAQVMRNNYIVTRGNISSFIKNVTFEYYLSLINRATIAIALITIFPT